MLEILLKNKYEQGTCINYDQPNAGSNFGSDDILVFMKFKEVLKQKMFNIFLYSKLTTRQKKPDSISGNFQAHYHIWILLHLYGNRKRRPHANLPW